MLVLVLVLVMGRARKGWSRSRSRSRNGNKSELPEKGGNGLSIDSGCSPSHSTIYIHSTIVIRNYQLHNNSSATTAQLCNTASQPATTAYVIAACPHRAR